MFKWFKKILKSNIVAPEKSEKLSVFLSSSKPLVKLMTKIEVKKNYTAIITNNNKVLDVFNEGEYELSIPNLPHTTKKLKLDRVDKKTKRLPQEFFADIYYVNKNVFQNVQFKNTAKIEIDDKKYKKCKVGFEGEFSYKIVNPAIYLECLFYKFSTIKGNMAEDQLGYWVSEFCYKVINKNKPTLEMLYMRDSKCFENMLEYVNKNIFDIGIEVLSINITKITLPKKIYKETTIEYTECVVENKRPLKEDALQTVFRQEAESSGSVNIGRDYNTTQPDENINSEAVEIRPTIQQTTDIKTIAIKTCPYCGAKCTVGSKICFSCCRKFEDV